MLGYGGIIEALDGPPVSSRKYFYLYFGGFVGKAEGAGRQSSCVVWISSLGGRVNCGVGARNTWFTRSASDHVVMKGLKGVSLFHCASDTV